MPAVRRNWLQRVASSAAELLFPATCLACNAELEQTSGQTGFCSHCCKEMQRGDWPVCRRCASRVPKLPGTVDECGHCRGQKLWFDRSLALGDYDGLLREQCLNMKTDRSERLAHALGPLICQRLSNELRQAAPDAIVPVPMHAWRRLARGTNPPAALASSIGRSLKLPVYSGLLCKSHNTQPQIGLSNPARFRNVRGEVQITANYRLEGPHVLLVDDIMTTGATCSEAARILKRAGASKVTVIVAARTPSY